jgi:hypothetical protein
MGLFSKEDERVEEDAPLGEQWEYLVRDHTGKIESWLNELGRQGWECFFTAHNHWYFKRRPH